MGMVEDGDSWESEAPISEASERYQVKIFNGPALARTVETTAPSYLYLGADITADFGPSGPGASLSVAVSQISDAVGPGVEAAATLTL